MTMNAETFRPQKCLSQALGGITSKSVSPSAAQIMAGASNVLIKIHT